MDRNLYFREEVVLVFFCNDCGQSPYIDDDCFIEIRNTSGWESVRIDPEEGDHVDYSDSETTDSDHDHYECPHCGGQNIDSAYHGNEEEARSLRDTHQVRMDEYRRRNAEDRKQHELERQSKDPERKWDVDVNL